ncbi:OmpA family protein [Longitalea luteola]|uniref:OmpA family protein n=1 Tax=Longitalea luteola TaxID=2812563 RepID=UPI001A966499|nr:OmpA family protein [Longitalea luteola]
MKCLFVCCILLYWRAIAYTQNLLANGGFEDENICIEYIKNCAPEAWIATSLTANYYFDATQKGAAKAHTGTHFIGLTAGSLSMEGIRNFVRTRLLCGLRKGHQYRLKMYIRSPHSILDSIGVYFSEQDYLYEKRYFKLITPQLWSINGMDTTIRNPAVWQKVEFLYTADGTEGYIAIGNYKRNDYTGIQHAEYRHDYYFFLDDVSLTPVDSQEKICLQADSVRRAIYEENERHSYLVRKVYQYRRNPPPVLPLPKTAHRKAQHIDTLVIPDIFFATGSYQLSPVSYHLLDSFASKLSLPVIDSMVVEGHTDSIGKLAYNETLSLNRAESVKMYLAGKVRGLDVKTTTRGFAYRRPLASNKTPKGRQLNRRVEIFLYKNDK